MRFKHLMLQGLIKERKIKVLLIFNLSFSFSKYGVYLEQYYSIY